METLPKYTHYSANVRYVVDCKMYINYGVGNISARIWIPGKFTFANKTQFSRQVHRNDVETNNKPRMLLKRYFLSI